MRFFSRDCHDIAFIVAEHEREKVMKIDLQLKYSLGKRVFEAFGNTDYSDVLCIVAKGAKHWLPTNAEGWDVVRSGFALNTKVIPTADLVSKMLTDETVVSIHDEVVAHFQEQREDYEANLATYNNVYPVIYDMMRKIRSSEQLAERMPEYLDVLAFYLTE